MGACTGRVVAPVGGTGGRVGAGAWVGGAADTLCDRSRREALIEASLHSGAVEVGRVATIDCWCLIGLLWCPADVLWTRGH